MPFEYVPREELAQKAGKKFEYAPSKPKQPNSVTLAGGLSVPLEDSTRDENMSSWARYLYGAIHQTDRPRIAHELALINSIEGAMHGEPNVAKTYGEGLQKGLEVGTEGKSFVGANYWFEVFDRAKKSPEEYPMVATIYDGLSKAYQATTGGLWGEPSAYRRNLESGIHDSPEVQGTVATILGMATDIKADPIGRILKAGGAGVKALGQGVSWINDIIPGAPERNKFLLKHSQNIVDGFMESKYVDNVFRLFSDRYGLTNNPEYNSIYDQWKTINKMAKGASIKENRKLQKEIISIANRVGGDYKEVSRFMLAAVERKGTWDQNFLMQLNIDSVDPNLVRSLAQDNDFMRLVYTVKLRNQAQLKKEIAYGAKYTALGESDKKLLEAYEAAFQKADELGTASILHPLSKRAVKRETAEKEYADLRQKVADRDDIDYFIHAATPEFRKAAIAKQRGTEDPGEMSLMEVSEKTASQLKRTLNERGVQYADEINKLAREGNLPGFENMKFKDGAFVEDVALGQAIRDLRHNKLINNLTFHRTAAEKFGIGLPELHAIAANHIPGFNKKLGLHSTLQALKTLPQDQLDKIQELSGLNIKDLRSVENQHTRHLLKNKAFPSQIATSMDKHVSIVLDPEKRNALLKGFDHVTGIWKASTLAPFMSYHVRNMVGNYWNNYVGDVDMRAYKDAARFTKAKLIYESQDTQYRIVPDSDVIRRMQTDILRDYSGRPITRRAVGLPAVHGGQDVVTYADIHNYMDKMGVRGRGMFGVEMEKEFRKSFELGGRINPLDQNFALYTVGRAVGENTEDFFRVANFVDSLKKGKTVEQASAKVKHDLFDYEELTDFEKNTMRRIMPFYSWSRKNIPFQIEGMIRHPGKYRNVDIIRQNIEASHGEGKIQDDEYLLSSWYVNNYPVNIRLDEKGKPQYFLLGGWIPAFDVWKVASSMDSLGWDFLKDNLHPLGKAIIETGVYPQLTKKDIGGPKVLDLFTGKETAVDEKVDFLGERVSPRIKQWLKNIRALNEVDKFMQAYSDGKYPTPNLLQGEGDKSVHTPGSAWLNFITGAKLYTAEFNKMAEGALRKYQKEVGATKGRIKGQVIRQAPEEEIKGTIDKLMNLDMGVR